MMEEAKAGLSAPTGGPDLMEERGLRRTDGPGRMV